MTITMQIGLCQYENTANTAPRCNAAFCRLSQKTRVHELIRIWHYVKEIQIQVACDFRLRPLQLKTWYVCRSLSESATKMNSMHNRHPLVDKSISSTTIHCFGSVSTRSCHFSSICTHTDSRKKILLLLQIICISVSLCLYGNL